MSGTGRERAWTSSGARFRIRPLERAWAHAEVAFRYKAPRGRQSPTDAPQAKDAVGGHHVPGTPYNWRHEWRPLNLQTARRYGKPFEGADHLTGTKPGKRPSPKPGAAATRPPGGGGKPEEKPESVRYADMRVGDRVDIGKVGTIINIERTGKDRLKMTIREDDGTTTTVHPFDSLYATRLVKADTDVPEQIDRMVEEGRRQVLRDEVAQVFQEVQAVAYRHAARTGDPDPGQEIDRQAAAAIGDQTPEEAAAIHHLAAFNLVRRLAPDADKHQQEQLERRLDSLIAEVANRARANVRQAVRGATPLGEERESDAVRRVLRQYREDPPLGDYEQVADALADLGKQLSGTPSGDRLGPVPRLPELPEGMDVAERVKAYRAAIDGGPENFGKVRVRRTVPSPLSLADLEAGRTPGVETQDTFELDRAADGGPGETALHHLAVLRAAGADLNAEIERARQRLGAERENEYDQLRRAAQRANDKHERVVDAREQQVMKALNLLAKQEGYASWDALTDAWLAARDEHGRDSAAYKKLTALRSGLSARARSVVPSTEVNKALAEVNLLAAQAEAARRDSYAGSLRDAARDVLAKARNEPMGGTQLTYRQGVSRDYGPGAVTEQLPAARKAMRLAEESYPQEWLERIHKNKQVDLTVAKRGYHKSGSTPTVALSKTRAQLNDPRDGGYAAVAVHELGHEMESAVPGLLEAENVFLWSRTTRSGAVGARRREPLTTIYQRTNEVGWKDNFRNHYTGRDYGGRNYEVFTTGMESLMAGSEYLDDDFRNWLVGSLALL
jgi:hypothetical protein